MDTNDILILLVLNFKIINQHFLACGGQLPGYSINHTEYFGMNSPPISDDCDLRSSGQTYESYVSYECGSQSHEVGGEVNTKASAKRYIVYYEHKMSIKIQLQF